MNEIPRNGFLLLSGAVRVYSVDTNGFERTVSYISNGDLLPGAYLLGLSKHVLHFYESVTPLEVLEFKISDFREELESNPELVLSLLRVYSLGYFGSLVQIEALVQHRAQEKVLKLLRYLMIRFGKEVDNSWVSINIPLTQNDIADMIGITRETVAVELGRMKSKGIIDYGSFTYRVNREILSDVVNADLWESFRHSD